MSAYNAEKKAVALQYKDGAPAPIVIASGMGHLAEKMVEIAADNGVPVYEDTSLATMLSQLQLGQAIPEELYSLVVDIYVYFLHFDPNHPERTRLHQNDNRAETAQPPVPSEAEVSTDERSE